MEFMSLADALEILISAVKPAATKEQLSAISTVEDFICNHLDDESSIVEINIESLFEQEESN